MAPSHHRTTAALSAALVASAAAPAQDWVRKPILLTEPTIAYDPGRDRLVMYSGFGTSLGTWEWDGFEWILRATSIAGPPTPRLATAMAYDPNSRSVLLYGGFRTGSGGSFAALADLWSWDGFAWTRLSPGALTMRGHHAMVTDERHRQHKLTPPGSRIRLSEREARSPGVPEHAKRDRPGQSALNSEVGTDPAHSLAVAHAAPYPNGNTSGGPRAGATTGASRGFPRCASTRRTAAASITDASTLRTPPHAGHRSTSVSNTRFINSAHEYRLRRVVAVAPSPSPRASSEAPSSPCSSSGTTNSRPDAAGAKTP